MNIIPLLIVIYPVSSEVDGEDKVSGWGPARLNQLGIPGWMVLF